MDKTTFDHEEIKVWATKYDGKPEIIDHRDAKADTVGIRINFPGDSDDVLMSDSNPPKEISWKTFFKIFDEQRLSFEYSEKEAAKNPGFAYRFSNRE